MTGVDHPVAERQAGDASGRRQVPTRKLTFPAFVKLPQNASSSRESRAARGPRARSLGPVVTRWRQTGLQRRKSGMLGAADPDRRLRHQLALRPGRGRLHADVRRLRRAEPGARRHHGGGGADRLAAAAGELGLGIYVGSAGRRRSRACSRPIATYLDRGAADPALAAPSRARRPRSSCSPARCSGAS